jgi:hypothetical protein
VTNTFEGNDWREFRAGSVANRGALEDCRKDSLANDSGENKEKGVKR